MSLHRSFLVLSSFLFLAASTPPAHCAPQIVVSVPDQKLFVVENGRRIAKYPVSTSRFGVGDRARSFFTPLGRLAVAGKFGAGAPLGAVFKGRRATGEVLRPNAPGRDPIVTRILRLRGLERGNKRAYARGIYIHGTPVEGSIGRPASYGCIRMRSLDMVRVFDAVPVGTPVQIINSPLSTTIRAIGWRHRLGSV